MKRHHAIKRPSKNGNRFSWGRVYDEKAGRVTYRLFRRCMGGRVFVESRTFEANESRDAIAINLQRMRRRLLDAVDAVDLATLGLEAA